MMLVDFHKIGYEDESFIMTYKASQVFHVKDPMFERWYVVLCKETQDFAHEDQ